VQRMRDRIGAAAWRAGLSLQKQKSLLVLEAILLSGPDGSRCAFIACARDISALANRSENVHPARLP